MDASENLLSEKAPHRKTSALESRWQLVGCTAFCGVINNASFCVLLGASQEIANEFGQQTFQPLIVNISTAGSVIGVFFSSKVMVGRMGDRSRLTFVTAGNAVGYALIGMAYRVARWDPDPADHQDNPISPSWGFWVCTLGAFVLGFTASVGEVMNLATCTSYEPRMLAAWGAGTGLSGIIGPFLFISLSNGLHMNVGEVAFVCAAFLPLYFAAYWRVVIDRRTRLARADGTLPLGVPLNDTVEQRGGAVAEGGSVSFTCGNMVIVSRFARVVLINMVLVYGLEYMVSAPVRPCHPVPSMSPVPPGYSTVLSVSLVPPDCRRYSTEVASPTPVASPRSHRASSRL